MFNKFKIGEKVLIIGIGKSTEKLYFGKGIIVEKDYFYKDYCIRLKDGSEEWFDERDLYKILKNGGK